MGWLLACRQAYADGVDILYSTNTFFVESVQLLDAILFPIPTFVVPERLALITSLELRWDIRV
ncbi:hypothetical protein B0T16DRAFT_336810, partial [Cercophora newfieldiana]